MTNKEIKSSASAMRRSLKEARKNVVKLEQAIQRIQSKCPHAKTKSWTEEYGFDCECKVEKCLVCGRLTDSRWP